MRTILTYDQTFEGFLCCIFQCYEQKLKDVRIVGNSLNSENFFDDLHDVTTEAHKARRVWLGLDQSFSKKGKRALYKAFLSERPEIENILLHYIRRQLKSSEHIDSDFTDPKILHIAKVVKMVDREKHRMDAFVRFRLTRDGLYFATVEPDFNVLPLNAEHFKKRYADQRWLIYDLKRNYGVYYNLEEVAYVQLHLSKNVTDHTKQGLYVAPEELAFQELWKNYFNSTNIESRKNMRLHVQHVPKRYWKYLSEKLPDFKNKK